MNIIIEAMKHFRKDNRNVYGGYGDHLDKLGKDIYLIQAIGDAIAVYRTYHDSIKTQILPDNEIYMSLCPKEDDKYLLFDNGEVDEFSVIVKSNDLLVGAYDDYGQFIGTNGNVDIIEQLKLIIPACVGLLVKEEKENGSLKTDLSKFLQKGDKINFNKLYIKFCKKYVEDDYNICYGDIKIELDNIIETEEEVPLFSDELLAFVPQLSHDEFLLPKRLLKISHAVKNGDIRTLLLHGPAGTGKTMACKLLAREIKYPLMATINCTENLDEFILGKYIPVGSEITFQESEVTRAIREGGIVVFEEINFAKPQYLAFLNSLLDDNGFVRLDNGTIVKRHPQFRFFATMNMGYFGTKELNQALYNRFNAIVEIPTLSDEDITRMLIKRVPSCKSYVKKLIGTYNKIRNLIEKQELDIVISPRNLENWARLAKYEGYINAAESTIVPICKEDKDLAEAIRNIIQTYRWDNSIASIG